MPEHPMLGVVVGFLLAIVSSISTWSAARPKFVFVFGWQIPRVLFGFLIAITVGMTFCAFSGADFEWMFLLGAVWVVGTAGSIFIEGPQVVEATSSTPEGSLRPSQFSLLELGVFATIIACLAASARHFSHPEFRYFFMWFSFCVGITCFAVTSLTTWACLSPSSWLRRCIVLVVSTMLVAVCVHQAVELAMAITKLSRPGVAGFVWVIALVTNVLTTSLLQSSSYHARRRGRSGSLPRKRAVEPVARRTGQKTFE